MTDRFLPDYGLYLLKKGVRPETHLVFFNLPVDHLTRPALRTVSITLSTEEAGQDYAISFDFIGPRIDDLLAAFPEPARERLWRWLENRGSGINGTANRLKRSASPVAVSPVHAGIAFREAVAVVRLA